MCFLHVDVDDVRAYHFHKLDYLTNLFVYRQRKWQWRWQSWRCVVKTKFRQPKKKNASQITKSDSQSHLNLWFISSAVTLYSKSRYFAAHSTLSIVKPWNIRITFFLSKTQIADGPLKTSIDCMPTSYFMMTHKSNWWQLVHLIVFIFMIDNAYEMLSLEIFRTLYSLTLELERMNAMSGI